MNVETTFSRFECGSATQSNTANWSDEVLKVLSFRDDCVDWASGESCKGPWLAIRCRRPNQAATPWVFVNHFQKADRSVLSLSCRLFAPAKSELREAICEIVTRLVYGRVQPVPDGHPYVLYLCEHLCEDSLPSNKTINFLIDDVIEAAGVYQELLRKIIDKTELG